jgi:tripartite ATP-independent transporter DctP family solute receptor
MLAGCGGDSSPDDTAQNDTMTIVATSPFAATHPWSMGMHYLAGLLSERTDGQMTVSVFYSDAIGGGSTTTVIEMTGTGANHMMINSPLVYQNWNPNFAVFSLPFLFPSQEIGLEFMRNSDVGNDARYWLTDQGMTGVGVVMNGYRQLTNSRRPVTSPEDIAGLKLRIPNTRTLISTFSRLGVDPTILSMAEVYTSIQNGTVDGQENPVAVIYSNRIYEVAPYITLWTYMWDPAFVMVNTELLESMTEEQRRIFLESVDEMCDWIINALNEQMEAQIQTFIDRGSNVIELTDAQNAAFRAATAGVYDEFRDEIGSELIDKVLNTIEQLAN